MHCAYLTSVSWLFVRSAWENPWNTPARYFWHAVRAVWNLLRSVEDGVDPVPEPPLLSLGRWITTFPLASTVGSGRFTPCWRMHLAKLRSAASRVAVDELAFGEALPVPPQATATRANTGSRPTTPSHG